VPEHPGQVEKNDDHDRYAKQPKDDALHRSSPRTASIGTIKPPRWFLSVLSSEVNSMHELIYLVGLVVVVMFILSALGLH